MLYALSFVDPVFFFVVALLSIGSAGIGIGIPLQGYVIGGGGPGAGVSNYLMEDGTSNYLMEDGTSVYLMEN